MYNFGQAFANNSSANLKLSKTEISKKGHQEGNQEDIYIYTDAAIYIYIYIYIYIKGSSMRLLNLVEQTTLIISNKEMGYILAC